MSLKYEHASEPLHISAICAESNYRTGAERVLHSNIPGRGVSKPCLPHSTFEALPHSTLSAPAVRVQQSLLEENRILPGLCNFEPLFHA